MLKKTFLAFTVVSTLVYARTAPSLSYSKVVMKQDFRIIRII